MNLSRVLRVEIDDVPGFFNQVELTIGEEVSRLLSLWKGYVTVFLAVVDANWDFDFLMWDPGAEIGKVILESNIEALRESC